MTVERAQHQRDRIRQLETRVDGLTRYRDQLERAYALACQAIAGSTATTDHVTAIAAVIHELAELAPNPVEETRVA